ncbi:MAG: hypothetical protein KF799_04515 [Bdellovibrionales bacterium]|nr:hypothetical protein [Bdellovibrionales bacterium]
MYRLLSTAFVVLALSAPAWAQTNIAGSRESVFRDPSAADGPRVLGWSRSGSLGVNISLSSSQDVVGQTNGSSQTYGSQIKGNLNHLREVDEWKNELALRQSTTKTPNVPRFVKSDDEMKLTSMYLYFLPSNPKIGPYVRAEAAAPIFKGEDVRADVKTYRLKHLDASSPDSVTSGTSLRLTDGFKPLTTKEAVGFFYRPVHNEKLHVETRLGFAGQQIAANGQYAVSGVNAAGEVEVKELENVSQAGLEAGLSVKGKVDEKTTYELGADTLTPFINNKAAGDRRDAWRLTNVDGFFKLTSKVTDWASFGYDYKLKIQPQLVDRAQQIHMVVINITYPVTPEKL